MTLYRGFRDKKNAANALDRGIVMIEVGDDLGPLPMSKRAHSKSPCGFNWGYNGSGPAALAHSILTHFASVDVADRFHQQFKVEHIATLPQGEEWTITGDEINTFLESVGEDRVCA